MVVIKKKLHIKNLEKFNVSFSNIIVFVLVINESLGLITYFIDHLFGLNTRMISKPLDVFAFFLCVIFSFYIRKLKIIKETILYLFFFFLAFAIGIMRGNVNADFFSHVYTGIMPIILVSVGYYYCKNLLSKKDQELYLNKIFKITTWVSFIISLLYILVKKTGDFNANSAIASSISIAFIYFMINDNKKYVILCLIAILLGNKRSVMLMAGFAFLYYIYLISRKNFYKIIKYSFVILILIFIVILIYTNTNLLDRFNVFLNINKNIELNDVLNLITSNRWIEVDRTIEMFNNYKVFWLIGSGFGTTLFIDFKYIHFIHFSPFSYVLIYGSLFSILMYYFFIKENHYSINQNDSKTIYFYRVLWYSLIFASLFSSMVSTYMLFWFFLGGNAYIKKIKTYKNGGL